MVTINIISGKRVSKIIIINDIINSFYFGWNIGYRLDGSLDPWLKIVWEEIMEKYPLPAGVDIIPEDVLLSPSLRVELLSNETTLNDTTKHEQRIEPHNLESEFDMVVKSNERITDTKHFQDVRHLVLEASSEVPK